MRHDVHLTVAKADVRGHALPRHATRPLEASKAYACATAIGLPRFWDYVLRAALEGAAHGFSSSDAESAAGRLWDALQGSRRRTAEAIEATIERMLPDATLMLLMCEGDALHVLSAGRVRAPETLVIRTRPRTPSGSRP